MVKKIRKDMLIISKEMLKDDVDRNFLAEKIRTLLLMLIHTPFLEKYFLDNFSFS